MSMKPVKSKRGEGYAFAIGLSGGVKFIVVAPDAQAAEKLFDRVHPGEELDHEKCAQVKYFMEEIK